MSSNVTRKSSIANRPTCGGPIKAGLAPRATNFNLSMKTNHRFSGRPFVDNKNSSDYACNGSGGDNRNDDPFPKPSNSKRMKVYIATGTRFNTEVNVEDFSYTFEQLDNTFVNDLAKTNMYDKSMFDLTYIYFDRAQEWTKDENDTKQLHVAATHVNDSRDVILGITENDKTIKSTNFILFTDFLKEFGNPDVLVGRFGSGTTARWRKAIEEVCEWAKLQKKDMVQYPDSVVWSLTSTAAYLTDENKVVRSQMSDLRLAPMFVSWLSSNIEEKFRTNNNLTKFKIQFLHAGEHDSWARNLATSLLTELKDVYNSYSTESQNYDISFPDTMEDTIELGGEGYKFVNEDGTEITLSDVYLPNLGKETETYNWDTESYSYIVVLPNPSYSANGFMEQLDKFLGNNPSYMQMGRASLITGDSFFGYSPNVSGLTNILKTVILTMANSDVDQMYVNLVNQWYGVDSPKLAKLGGVFNNLNTIMKSINSSDSVIKSPEVIQQYLQEYFGEVGTGKFNSCGDMANNQISVGQVVPETYQRFLWEDLRNAAFGEEKKTIVLRVSLVDSGADFLIKNAKITNEGKIVADNGIVHNNQPIMIQLNKNNEITLDLTNNSLWDEPIQTTTASTYYLTDYKGSMIKTTLGQKLTPSIFYNSNTEMWTVTDPNNVFENGVPPNGVWIRSTGNTISSKTEAFPEEAGVKELLTNKETGVLPFWEKILNDSLTLRQRERVEVKLQLINEQVQEGENNPKPMILDMQEITLQEGVDFASQIVDLMQPYSLTQTITTTELEEYASTYNLTQFMNNGDYSYDKILEYWTTVGEPNGDTLSSAHFATGDIRIAAPINLPNMTDGFAAIPVRGLDYGNIGTFGGDVVINYFGNTLFSADGEIEEGADENVVEPMSLKFLLAHEIGHSLGLKDREFKSSALISIMNQGRKSSESGLGDSVLGRKFVDFQNDCAKYGNTKWESQQLRNLYLNSYSVFRPIGEITVQNTVEGTVSKTSTFSTDQLLHYFWSDFVKAAASVGAVAVNSVESFTHNTLVPFANNTINQTATFATQTYNIIDENLAPLAVNIPDLINEIKGVIMGNEVKQIMEGACTSNDFIGKGKLLIDVHAFIRSKSSILETLLTSLAVACEGFNTTAQLGLKSDTLDVLNTACCLIGIVETLLTNALTLMPGTAQAVVFIQFIQWVACGDIGVQNGTISICDIDIAKFEQTDENTTLLVVDDCEQGENCKIENQQCKPSKVTHCCTTVQNEQKWIPNNTAGFRAGGRCRIEGQKAVRGDLAGQRKSWICTRKNFKTKSFVFSYLKWMYTENNKKCGK